MSLRTHGAVASSFAVILLLVGAERAAAQCTTIDPPCTNEGPAVSISPSGGSYTGQNRSVNISWSDDGYLNFSSIDVELNGNPVSLNLTQHTGSSGTSSGTIQLSSGTNILWAEICDTQSECTQRSASYTYTPPPPPQQHAPPLLDFSPHHPHFSVPSPFDAQVAYATQAYVSMDQPRSVALVYNSSRAKPIAFVALDVIDNSTTPISRFDVKVKNASGAPLTLINGAQEMSFGGANGRNRVAVQWDAGSLSTWAYKYTITVRTWFTDGAWTETSDTTRVVVVNESNSPFGAGWSMPGLQKGTGKSQGVVITEGDGRGVYFRPLGSGLFAAPPGEFTNLVSVGDSLYRLYPDSSMAVFDHLNQLIRVEDRFGNKTSYSYSSGRVSSITDPAGKQFTFTYNGAGKLTTITDEADRSTSVTINGSGDLTQITAPGSVTAFSATYDAGHRMRTRTDMRGSTASYAYDFAWRLAADTLPEVNVHGVGNARPVVTYKSWESAALVSNCGCTRPRINPDTLRARITDPVGNATRVKFDRYFGPTVVDAPLGHTDSIMRNGNGLPTRIREPSGATRTFTWNSNGTLANATQSETNQTIYFDYHSTWVTEPDTVNVGSSETVYRYGTSGELQVVRVNQDSTRYEYHPDWRLKKITDPQNHVTEHTYQTTGFKNTLNMKETSSAGTQRQTSFAYDGYGRTTSVTTPAGTTAFLYDDLDRVTRVTDPLNKATNYAYDGAYVDTVTDAANKIYAFTRNALGWVTSEKDTNGRTTSYAYDAAGNPRQVINRRSQTITLTPDALGRVVSRTADGATTTYAFDNPSGRWVAASNAESTDTTFFDDRGRVSQEVTWFAGTQRYEIASRYLAEGPRDTLEIFATGASRTIAYNYSNALRLTAISQLVGGVTKTTSINYNQDGLPSSIVYPTSTTVTQSLGYTASHRPQSNGWSGNLAPLRVSYTWDSMERLTKRMNAAQDSARILAYNARGELTNARDEEYWEEWVCPTMELTDCYWEPQTDILANVSHTYDNVGNRTDSGASLQSSSNRYSAFGGYNFTYDLTGNVLTKTKSGYSQTYTWNSLDQLTSVTTNGTTVSYGYNGFGERIKRTQGSDVRRYLYDGPNVVLEVNGTGTKLREYTHFPGVDQPHSMFDGNGAVYYYATDYPGQVAGLFNASGTVANRYRYSAWGLPETTSEGISNSLRYMSREVDSQTGVYYVRNRWYDATVARFLSEDPIGLEGGINVYAYVGNSPTNTRDPFGLGPVVTRYNPWGWDFENPRNPTPSNRGDGFRVENEGGGMFDEGGGGGSSTGRTSQTASKPEPSRVEPPSAAQCAAAYYGVGDVALRGFLTAPIPKRWVGLPVIPGASSFTNATSLIGFKLFPGLKLGTQILGTNRVFGLAGRASAIGGGVLLVYDATTIALCSSRYGL